MKIIIVAALLVILQAADAALATTTTARRAQGTDGSLQDNIDQLFPSAPTVGIPPPMKDDDIDDYVAFKGDRHDEFDWSLIKSVLLKNDSNIVVSPFSIKLVLAILYEAAAPDTKTHRELHRVIPNNNIQTREFYEGKLRALTTDNEFNKLNIATRMFVDNFVEPKQRYSAILEKYYKTKIEKLNFADSDSSKNHINEWCANNTMQHIKKIVNAEEIANSVMIMLNAIYFKGVWRRPFNEESTVELPFFLSADKQTKVQYMTEQAKYFYHDSAQLGVKVLRIPYKGKKFGLNIMMPTAKGGLNELIHQLEVNTLRNAQWLMDEVEVKVQIPKFKFEYETKVKPILQGLGINEIFTNDASLPALDRGSHLMGQLRVSNAIQKAGIFVNEQGSTAYAATEFQIVNKFGDPTHEFIANRPFLFFLEDESTGTILFVGKISNPDEFAL